MSFDVIRETEEVVNFVRKYFKNNSAKGAIVGLSGGKDSSVALALTVQALGKENVIGITMPCYSLDIDREYANIVANHFGVKVFNINLKDTFDVFREEILKLNLSSSEQDFENCDINIKPRLRMATLYYFASLYSSIKHEKYLVTGTSNKSELYVGYFTKGGDNVCAFEVLSNFTVSEVIQIGEYLKVPKKVLYRVPSDGLSGKTDEEKLGIKYDDIEKYIYGKELRRRRKYEDKKSS